MVSDLVKRSSNFAMPAVLQRDADGDLVIGAADPGEFRRVILRSAFIEQRIEGDAACGRAEDGAVARRRRIEKIGEPEAPGALHVLRHDGRISRNVLADMPRQEPAIKVIAAADAIADLQIDRSCRHRMRRGLARGPAEARGPPPRALPVTAAIRSAPSHEPRPQSARFPPSRSTSLHVLPPYWFMHSNVSPASCQRRRRHRSGSRLRRGPSIARLAEIP